MAKTRSSHKPNARNAFRPEDYSYNVAWSDEDKAFIGRVAEFPSLNTEY